MKKIAVLSVLVLAVLFAFASCGQQTSEAEAEPEQEASQEPADSQERQWLGAADVGDEPVRVGFSMPTATHGYMARAIYWAEKAMDDWRAKDPNVEFLFVTADNVTKQANDIEDLVTKGIDSLIVFPFDASVTSVVEDAYNQDIFVVVMDRGTSKPVYDVYLHNNDEAYARTGMEWLSEALDYEGDVVIIEGIPTPINTVRVNAIKAVADKYPGINILDSQPGEWNKQKSLAVMENYLQKYPNIDGVYTADDDMMLGALQAYKESGRDDIQYFLGGGADKRVIKMIMDGSEPMIQADVTYPPDQCGTAVTLGVMGGRGQNFDGFYQQRLPFEIVLSAELVTADNAEQYYFPDEP